MIEKSKDNESQEGGKPMSPSKLRNKLRGYVDSRRALDAIEGFGQDFLKKFV